MFRMVSSGLYNTLMHSSVVRNISTGLASFRLGVDLLRTPADPEASRLWQVGRKVAGVALVVSGMVWISNGSLTLKDRVFGEPSAQLSTSEVSNNLYIEGEYSESQIAKHPMIVPGQCTKEVISDGLCPTYPEFFKQPLNNLYLSASVGADHNGAFSPELNSSLPACLTSTGHLVYKVVQHPLQICEEIQSASQKQPIDNLILGGHGSPFDIKLGPSSSFKNFEPIPSECFQGLSGKAKIFLDSCLTGRYLLGVPNFAEWLSWFSGKEVIAPTDISVEPTCQLDVNGQLDIRFYAEEKQSRDITQSFNLASSFGSKTALIHYVYFRQFLFSELIVYWQTARLGLFALQAGTAATGWLIDQSAPYVKTLAQKSRIYHPLGAEVLYGAAKGSCQLLNTVAKVVDKGMDLAIWPMNQLGRWAIALISN